MELPQTTLQPSSDKEWHPWYFVYLFYFRSLEWAFGVGPAHWAPERCEVYGPAYEDGVKVRPMVMAKNPKTHPPIRVALRLCGVDADTAERIKAGLMRYEGSALGWNAKLFMATAWRWLHQERYIPLNVFEEAQGVLNRCGREDVAGPDSQCGPLQMEEDDLMYSIVKRQGGLFVSRTYRELWCDGQCVEKRKIMQWVAV